MCLLLGFPIVHFFVFPVVGLVAIVLLRNCGVYPYILFGLPAISCAALLASLVLRRRRVGALKIADACLFLLAAICFLQSFVLIHQCSKKGWRGTELSSNVEFPLPGCKSDAAIAVDSRDRVYLATAYYHRIQTYDKEGNFLRSWFAECEQEAHWGLYIDEEDRVHVGLYDKTYVHDPDGQLLSVIEGETDSDRKSLVQPLIAEDRGGNTFRLEPGWLLDRVLKTGPEGKESVFISERLGAGLMKPHVTALGFLASFFLWAVVHTEVVNAGGKVPWLYR
jgi:hypothetical protein